MTARSIKATADTTSTDGVASPLNLSANPPWSLTRCTVTTGHADPDAGINAGAIIEDGTAGLSHFIYQTTNVLFGPAMYRTRFLAAMRGYAMIANGDNSIYCIWDGATGVVTASLACTGSPGVALGGGWWLFELSAPSNSHLTLVLHTNTDGTFAGRQYNGVLGQTAAYYYKPEFLYTIETYTLPSGYFGKLTFDITGEKSGDPTKTYTYCCDALYSCDAGVATLRSQGTPVEIDPDAYGWEIVLDGSGANARARVVGIDGENWIWACKVTGLEAANQVGELIALGLSAYYDPYYSASVVGADTTYIAGAAGNLLPPGGVAPGDGDCEWADASVYSAQLGITNSKVNASPHGGLRNLRITNAGAGTLGAYQNAVAANQAYCASGYYRNDGVVTSRVSSTSTAKASFASQLVWTNFISVFGPGQMGGAGFYWQCGLGGWAEWDDLDIHRLPIVTGHTSQISGGAALSQPGAAGTRPTYLNLAASTAQGYTCPCWQTDGASQFFDTGYTPVDNFAVGGWFYVSSITGTRMFFGATDGASVAQLYQLNAQLIGRIGSGTELTNNPLTVGWHHLVIGRRGTTTRIWRDGTLATHELGGAPPALSLYLMARHNIATVDLWQVGLCANFGIWNHLPTTNEVLSEMAFSRPLGV